jgi:hypothetical protein
MSPKPSAKPSTTIVIDDRCKYVAASGRRCRAHVARDTSRASGYSSFCLPHSQMEQQFLDSKTVAQDLIGPIVDFRTNTAVNEVLGHLLKLVAENRIPLRNANAISYICQLILNSNEGVRHETNLVGGEEYEMKIINTSMEAMWGKNDDDEKEEEEADDEEKQDDQVSAAVKVLNG